MTSQYDCLELENPYKESKYYNKINKDGWQQWNDLYQDVANNWSK